MKVKKRLFVFICCPLTPISSERNHVLEFVENVRNACWFAVHLIKNGFSVYCPGTDYVYWLVDWNGPTDKEIYEQDLNIILRADALLVLVGAGKSPNCRKEIQQALDNGIPVFYSLYDLFEWKKEVEQNEN